MVTVRSDVAARYEFLAVVLADPDLLDLAFAEVIASWEAEPPRPPDGTLVATSERRRPQSRAWRAERNHLSWHAWLRAVPRPKVARSPPELSVPGAAPIPHGGRPAGSNREAFLRRVTVDSEDPESNFDCLQDRLGGAAN